MRRREGPGARTSPGEPGCSTQSKGGAGPLPEGSRSSSFPVATGGGPGSGHRPEQHTILTKKRNKIKFLFIILADTEH